MISKVETTHVILPPHTNSYGNAFGGQIMSWMDIIAGICAARHCKGPAVTAFIDELQFAKPIRLGDIVIMKAALNWTGKTSMEIGVRVEREDAMTGESEHCLSGYFTFVALGLDGKPKEVPCINPETPDELRRFNEARERREWRLSRRHSDAG